jgi:hypothetical protein
MKVRIANIGEGTVEIEMEITQEQFELLNKIADLLSDAECPEGYAPSLYIDEIKEEKK